MCESIWRHPGNQSALHPEKGYTDQFSINKDIGKSIHAVQMDVTLPICRQWFRQIEILLVQPIVLCNPLIFRTGFHAGKQIGQPLLPNQILMDFTWYFSSKKTTTIC